MRRGGGGGGGGGGMPGNAGTVGGIIGGNGIGAQAPKSGAGAGGICCSSSLRCTWVYVLEPITGLGATVGGGGGGGITGRAISASNLENMYYAYNHFIRPKY